MSRRRFVYTQGGLPCEPYEVDLDWRPPPRLEIVPDSPYEGLRATDGTRIDSRRRHREYMKQRGLTTADDFTESWAKAARDRENLQVPGLRDSIGRAMYETEKRRK